MQKLLNLCSVVLFGLVCFTTYSNAGVRFITDMGEKETFNRGCSSYVACESPKIGVGAECDGKYLSCQCPSDYAACESPKVGTGTACDGKYKSTDCQCPSEYDTICNGTNNIIATGAVSCDGKYKAAECKCPSNWYTAATCASPKVLGGASCITNYLTYRETCKCPSNYITCSNGGATGASSCTDDNGTKYTSCKSLTCADGGYLAVIPIGQTCTTVAYNGNTCYKDCKDPCAEYTKNADCYSCPKGDLAIAMDECYPKVKDLAYKCTYFPPNSECGLPASSPLVCAPQYYTPNYNCGGALKECRYSIPAEKENEGICRKWSCGVTNATTMEICISRCKLPDCKDCNPVCIQRDAVAP